MLAIVRKPWHASLCAAAFGCLGLAAAASVLFVGAPAGAKRPPPKAPAGPKNKAYEEIAIKDPDPKEWKLKKATLMAEGKFPEGAAGQEEEEMFDEHYPPSRRGNDALERA